jgi:hypothetical protein
MTKYKVIILALFAVFAFSAVAASNALAAHQWLKGGAPITKVGGEPSTTEGKILLHHIGGLAGELTIECNGKFDGTVGPGVADEITKALTLAGVEVTKTKPLSCTVVASKSSVCTTGTLVNVVPVDLPWKTELVLEGTSVFDNITENGKGLPGYETICHEIPITCTGKDRSKFIKNETTGALLEFLGELKAKCTDGGEGTILGSGIAIGFTVD